MASPIKVSSQIPSLPFSIFARGGSSRFADPSRTWNWQMIIPTTIIQKIIKNATVRAAMNSAPKPFSSPIGGMAGQLLIDEDLLVKCRSVTIPSKTVKTISTSFYGHKRIFPSSVEFSNILNVEFEETEFQTIKIFFDNWIATIEETDFRSGGRSGFRSENIENYVSPIILSMLSYNGSKQSKNVTFYNCFPTSIGEVALSYSDDAFIKYNVTFSFDYYEMLDEPLARIPGVS